MRKRVLTAICLIALSTALCGCLFRPFFLPKGTPSSGKNNSSNEQLEAIKSSIQNKYDIEDLEVVEYKRGKISTPVPFASGYDGTYEVMLRDDAGNEIHAYAETEADGSLHTYDDFEYAEILNDVVDKYNLPREEKITLSYNFQKFGVRNVLDEHYDGDLSKVEPVKVRIDYIDTELKDIDFPELKYVLVSYESKESLEGWYQDEWWSMPNQPPIGVKEIKTNDDYRTVYNEFYGDYIIASYTPIEDIKGCDDFDVEGLIGNGLSSASVSELSEMISVKATDQIKVAWKPNKEYTEDEISAMRMGIRFYYDKKDEYCYGARGVYLKNGYLVAECTKKEVDIVFVEP